MFLLKSARVRSDLSFGLRVTILILFTAVQEAKPEAKKPKAAKAAPVAESPKPKPAKKSKAVEPVEAKKADEKPAKKAKAEKPVSENKKKLKAMKNAPDAEAAALKEKEAKKAKAKKADVVEKEVAAEAEAEQSDSDVEMDDQTEALLKGFESDSDEEESAQEYKGEPIPELTKKAKNKLAKLAAKEAISAGPGTVYLGHIPHGFYENEMRQYFKQFGDITNLRLSRNKQTGKSKHYAFIQFSSGDVAEIVSKTMDNYILFGHILKCKIVPQAQVHEKLWEGANKRFKKVPWNKMEGRKLEMGMTEAGWDKRAEKEKKRREKKQEEMKALGYEFKAPELKSVKDVPKTPREPLVAPEAEEEEAVVEEPKVEAPKAAEPVKKSKRKADVVETEEPKNKKQKKLKGKASSDKLNVAAEAEKPAAKPVAEKKAEKPAKAEKAAEKKAEKAEKPAKKAKKTKA
jgi:nucleolar protein 15